MSIEIKINEDIKAAMLARDQKKLQALRAIKAALLLEKTKGAQMEIPKEIELSLLQKLVKQRTEAANVYRDNNRPDLEEEERFQAGIIQTYLPKPLSEEEIRERVQAIIKETGASEMKDRGRVMGMASKAMAGRADNKLISDVVKALLS
ncbi:MAG: GatB/YqeY domain-containing protein [Bacteroidales bacterium]|jgi:uncharacterized protein YqeY|nr:GatB/YqeY domain-containing protein [Bacteroidales bacterium]MDD2322362.1 GatB/YqeY domain-containing protein [Bacteroidales bacterium]MDD3009853.1 GatB/YqeY domain-containing protein [Bacteroidales bacterium]MDD3960932.1 GatB/YqeY domain-containing protein [Bacteroidales bacterium]MDY0285608.1 GatB/YqeY domain-containing protein [Bacteroidales bacterium]